MKNIRKNNKYYTRDVNRKIKSRQRKIKAQCSIIALSLIVMCTLALAVLFVIPSQAENRIAAEASCKYYRSIQIKKGDTLWSIANENIDTGHYNNTVEYIKEVKSINSLASDRIIAGNYIIIPYYSENNVYVNAVN